MGEEQELILSLKLEDTEILTYKIKSWDNYYFKKLYTYQANF